MPVTVEATSGRSMAIVPDDIFLATPGYRESVRWTVGGVPEGGLVPGKDYWILAESGVVGELVEASSETKSYVSKAKYLGAVVGATGQPGIPTTFPSGRPDAAAIFGQALDVCLSSRADAILIECGGNFLGTSVPEFLQCLMARRSDVMTLLAASDSFGALGGKRVLEDMGVRVDLITGPCTDTPTARQRTEAMCGVPARNMRTPFQG